MKFHVLLACGGTGSRAGGALPKQYQLIRGKPLLAYTLEAWSQVSNLASISLIVHPQDDLAQPICRPYTKVDLLHKAGATRTDTVRAGLEQLAWLGALTQDWVLVHDVARCGITPALIQSLMQACQHDAVGGLLALPVPDTLKQAQQMPSDSASNLPSVTNTISREGKWLAQTPQMFRFGLLQQALQHSPNCTDEASAVEALGLAPKLVRGSLRNWKVTYAEDFELMEKLLS